jgi:hypothetical protein
LLKLVQKAYCDTSQLQAQLANPLLWDRIRFRTNSNSPHREMSDIWVRYAQELIAGPHTSQWYEIARQIPEAKRLSEQVANDYSGALGGVLITKLPAGKVCYPHIDHGWHARYYEKYALQVKGNEQQIFYVDKQELRTETGDLFWFDNSHIHGVLNPSNEDRITMIICVRH